MRAMNAVEVVYIGPTNHRQSSYRATSYSGKATIPADFRLNTDDNALAALRALCDKMGWPKGEEDWVCGVIHNGNYIFTRRPA